MKHNLIGISGKIGSGKDTVGAMIQYLLSDSIDPYPEDLWKEYVTSDALWVREQQSGFANKKFGGKLKEIAGILIGCTEEDFEDRDFKNKELGPEWWYYSDGLFEGATLVPYMNAPKNITNNTIWYLIKLTPRLILQLLGTEAGRNIIHPNIWVNALFADYVCDDCGATECPTDEEDTGQMIHQSYPNWIITDMRFPNELEAVKARGGLTIRVNLIGNEDTGDHESETALDNSSFDVTINAEFGLDNLLESVKQIMPLIV